MGSYTESRSASIWVDNKPVKGSLMAQSNEVQELERVEFHCGFLDVVGICVYNVSTTLGRARPSDELNFLMRTYVCLSLQNAL